MYIHTEKGTRTFFQTQGSGVAFKLDTGLWWYLISFGACLIIFHVQQPVAFGLFPCPNQEGHQSDRSRASHCPSPGLLGAPYLHLWVPIHSLFVFCPVTCHFLVDSGDSWSVDCVVMAAAEWTASCHTRRGVTSGFSLAHGAGKGVC